MGAWLWWMIVRGNPKVFFRWFCNKGWIHIVGCRPLFGRGKLCHSTDNSYQLSFLILLLSNWVIFLVPFMSWCHKLSITWVQAAINSAVSSSWSDDVGRFMSGKPASADCHNRSPTMAVQFNSDLGETMHCVCTLLCILQTAWPRPSHQRHKDTPGALPLFLPRYTVLRT